MSRCRADIHHDYLPSGVKKKPQKKQPCQSASTKLGNYIKEKKIKWHVARQLLQHIMRIE